MNTKLNHVPFPWYNFRRHKYCSAYVSRKVTLQTCCNNYLNNLLNLLVSNNHFFHNQNLIYKIENFILWHLAWLLPLRSS